MLIKIEGISNISTNDDDDDAGFEILRFFFVCVWERGGRVRPETYELSLTKAVYCPGENDFEMLEDDLVK